MTIKAALPDLDGACNCLAARKVARCLTSAYDKALGPAGLRITQFTILNKVVGRGPITIERLAAAMAMDRTSLATNLKPLERDGLLVAAAAEVRRATAIEITIAGRAKVGEAIPLWKLAQDLFEAGHGAAASSQPRSVLGGVQEAGLDPWAESAEKLVQIEACSFNFSEMEQDKRWSIGNFLQPLSCPPKAHSWSCPSTTTIEYGHELPRALHGRSSWLLPFEAPCPSGCLDFPSKQGRGR